MPSFDNNQNTVDVSKPAGALTTCLDGGILSRTRVFKNVHVKNIVK